MTPDDVRRERFSPTPFGRRGLAPTEVAEFLDQIEVQLAALHREIVVARDEADRCRAALRQWASADARCRFQPDHRPSAPTNSPNWSDLAIRQRDGRRTRE